MRLTKGSRLGAHQVLGPLGAGGMGEVYRATDTKLGREVAIKVLPAEVAGDAERLARFEREAHLLAALNHPHIAAIYGLEEAFGKPFLVLELVEGEDLAERLKRGPIPVEEALEIAGQIASALEAAHEKGIVHRDLKPANVKLTPDGTVKVLDFGLAKAYAGESAHTSSADLSQSPTLAHQGTQAGVILGTAAYMSPEQARGKPVDKRSDIWAFGVVLWEMLTGQAVFSGETVSDTLAAILKEEPRWEELPEAVPARARRTLRRCLARNPRERYHDAADVRIDLVDAGDEPGAQDGAAGGTAATGRVRRRRWAAGGALLVLGVALGAASAWLRSRPASSPAVRFTVTPPGDSGRIQVLRVSRDGRRLVYTLSSERRLLVHDLDRFGSRPLAGTEGASRPFLSPDGRWLGFYQAGKIRKIALDGGDPTDICEAPEASSGATWGPGGVILFNPTWTGSGLWRVDAAGGRPVELTRPDRAKGETGHFWADVLPDGRAALFTIFRGQGLSDSKVGLADLDKGSYEPLFEGAAPSYVASGHLVYYKGGAYRAVPFDAARRKVTGPETTVLPRVRRLAPVGSAESYFGFADTGALAYVEGDSTLAEPLSRLAWVSREGHIEELPFEGYHGDFRLSLDGRRVAVVRFAGGQQQIYVYDLERGTAEQLTRDGQNFDPEWHPDGQRLAFASQLEGHFDVRWAPADGTGVPEPLYVTPTDEGKWRWAPDGASAVVQIWSPVSGTDFWQVRGASGEASPLLASPLSETDPAFSPDGKWLAYVSGDALYVAPYPALGQRVLIAPVAGAPRFSPSGAELFFVEQGRLKVVACEVRAGAFHAGAAQTLFDLGRLSATFDVGPDGRRFLFLASPSDQPSRDVIRVVLNGFDVLRAEAAAAPGR